LIAHLAGDVEGVADHNAHHLEAAAEPGQGAQVFAGIATPLQCQNRLSGQAQSVRDGYAYALGTNIETEIAGMCGGFQAMNSLPPA
jgi:hypothetical protein